jgi:hypothetical protein
MPQPNSPDSRPFDPSGPALQEAPETYNHWTIVNLVFHHLADQGLHPVLGGPESPGTAAADLLRALGVEPLPEGNRKVNEQVKARLAELRAAVFEE